MRETAEKELANISMNGHRDHSTPNNGSPTRSMRHSTKRLNRSSPSRLDQSRGGERSVTPNLHLGNMETMIEELKSARLLNQTVNNFSCFSGSFSSVFHIFQSFSHKKLRYKTTNFVLLNSLVLSKRRASLL